MERSVALCLVLKFGQNNGLPGMAKDKMEGISDAFSHGGNAPARGQFHQFATLRGQSINPHLRALLVSFGRCVCFNPLLAQRPGATFSILPYRGGALCFNPLPARRPGDTRRLKKVLPAGKENLSGMERYIGDVKRLLRQAGSIALPLEAEIQSAIKALSVSPVAGYPPFTAEEVYLLAAYRVALAQSLMDDTWKRIVNGEDLAWIYALHESAEIHHLQTRGVNPFRSVTESSFFAEAHLQATLIELQYLQEWAVQYGIEVSLSAIERTNPVRGQFPHAHRLLLLHLETHQNWLTPLPEELERAHQFWRRILIREPS
jgi:hypothetical protein